MSSGFLLLETTPGREGHVMDLLADLPGVLQSAVLFPAAIAVKVDQASFDQTADATRHLEGVLRARTYPARNA